MRSLRPAWLGILLLVACEHSPASTTELDRSVGPWQPGPPMRLTAHPVHVLGMSANGEEVLFRYRENPTPPHAGPRHHDTADVCLGMIPTTGGSGVWRLCDLRPEQADSLNALLAAAIDDAGNLIYTEATGPIDSVHPLREHVELYRGARNASGIRRQLLTLYRDALGRPTVSSSTVDWLEQLFWTGPDRFAALGYNAPPNIVLQRNRLGLVLGRIGADSATYTLVTDLQPFSRVAAGYSGTVLIAGLDLVVRSRSDDDARELWTSAIPAAPGRTVEALGCDPNGCRAFTREPGRPGIRSWQIGPNLDLAVIESELPVPSGSKVFVSAADGSVIYSYENDLFRIARTAAP